MAHTLIPRNTMTRDRHRNTLAKGHPPCYLCGKDLIFDPNCPREHPDRYVVDHIVPLDKGGSDTLDNKAPCCYACNSFKSNKVLLGYDTRRTFETDLVWR